MRELIVLEERRETIRTSLLPRAIQYKTDIIQVTPDKYFEKALASVLDMEKRINEKIAGIMQRQQAAADLIDTLTDSRHREVLTLYYMTYYMERRGKYDIRRLYTLEEIAAKMGYSNEHVRRLQMDAINTLEN